MPIQCSGLVDDCQANARSVQRLIRYRTNTFSTFHDLIESSIDAVIIAVPNHQHLPLIAGALEKRLDVFCEKPVTNSLLDALSVHRLVRESEKVLMVGFHLRYFDIIQKLKGLLENGSVGPIREVEACHNLDITSAVKSSSWLSNVQKSGGGVLHNVGVHFVNLLLHLFGRPVSVRAEFRNLVLTSNAGEDTAYCEFLYQSGTRVTLRTSMVNAFPTGGSRIIFRGTSGYIHADLAANWLIVETPGGRLQHVACRFHDIGGPSLPEFLNFYESVKKRLRPQTDIEDSIETMKCTMAASVAACEHREVFLQEIDDQCAV